MPEKFFPHQEHMPSPENHLTRYGQEKDAPSSEKQHEPARHEHAERIEVIRATAEAEAKKNKLELDPYLKERETEQQHPMLINSELKRMAYGRTMSRVRQRLPAIIRPFSKFVHQPVIEAISEPLSKTIARPSGVLAGGICVFIGSAIFLWTSRHYGYEYNFFLFSLLFIGGFFAGLLIEVIFRLFNRSRP
jgi:hypothetical protein